MNKTTIKISVLAFLGFMTYGYAQQQQQDPCKGKVGINTIEPSATMDIRPSTANAQKEATTNEGIIAPKLSKTRIANIATPVEGTLVYATDENTSPISAYTGGDTKVAKITEKGYYYYNGTEWVKAGSDATDQLWAQRDNGGVTETYLKPADANGDFVGYRNDRKYSISIGNIIDSRYPFNKIPNTNLISSDILKPSDIVENNNTFILSLEEGQLKDGIHNSNSSDYIFKGFHVTSKGSTDNFDRMMSTRNISSLHSNNKINTILGNQILSEVGDWGGTYSNATVTNNIASSIIASNFANSSNIEAIRARVNNYSKANTMRGFVLSLHSQEPLILGGASGAHTISQMRGMDMSININDNANVTNNVLGIRTQINVGENVTDGANIYGNMLGVETKSANDVKVEINRNHFVFAKDATKVHRLTMSNSIVDGNNLADIKVDTELTGFKYTKTNVDNLTSRREYGIHIDNVSSGRLGNYGIYLENVGNNVSNLNYSIYTNAGNIRFGDLQHSVNTNAASPEDRPVFVTADGVLKVGTASTIRSAWVPDTASNSVQLAITSANGDRTTHPISITDEGMVRATSFQGVNGATIFPDYVFQKYYTGTSSIKADYNFKSLSQVEDFVKANGHLPGYKSAATIKAQGYVDLMETQLTNVEKIEELYLHSIEQDKALKAKDAEIADLKQRLERLEKLIQ